MRIQWGWCTQNQRPVPDQWLISMNICQSNWWDKGYTIRHSKASSAIRMDEGEKESQERRKSRDFSVLVCFVFYFDVLMFGLFLLLFACFLTWFCFIWGHVIGMRGKLEGMGGEQNNVKNPKDSIRKFKKKKTNWNAAWYSLA